MRRVTIEPKQKDVVKKRQETVIFCVTARSGLNHYTLNFGVLLLTTDDIFFMSILNKIFTNHEKKH